MKKMAIYCYIAALCALHLGCTTPDTPDSGDNSTDKVITSIVPNEIVLSSEAANVELTVTAEGDWGVSCSDEWCKPSPSGGISGTYTVTVAIAENNTSAVRQTVLKFRTKGGTQEVPVRQNYYVEAVEFTDSALRTAMLEAYDTDGDGVLSSVEAQAVESIDIAGKGVTNVDDLNRYFAHIVALDCSNNNLTKLDISKLTRLTALNCANNRLSELDIRSQASLTDLDATGNPLGNIYVWSDFVAPEGFKVPAEAVYVEPEIYTPAGYALVWQDEFNTPGESGPSTAEWWYETGNHGWGNNELQDYVAGTYKGERLALVSDGTLKITAKKIDGKVRSIRVNTVKGWTYGYFEARLKLCSGKGTWPAFWMMPKNFTTWPGDGEIDIMEQVGCNANYVSSSIHCNAYNHSIGTQKTHELYLATAQTEFHTYAVEWTADQMVFYFDGKAHFTFKNDHKGDYNTWPFYTPFYLKLNLAWGGNWGGMWGVDESCLPTTYEIDYVRVFQKVE